LPLFREKGEKARLRGQLPSSKRMSCLKDEERGHCSIERGGRGNRAFGGRSILLARTERKEKGSTGMSGEEKGKLYGSSPRKKNRTVTAEVLLRDGQTGRRKGEKT